LRKAFPISLMLWMFLLAGILPMAAAFVDPTGLNNEGHRYRDLEKGEFISRDPMGFVDGPNVYCYVRQNPWSGFDPEGLQGIPVWETREAFAVDAAYRQGGQAAAQVVRDRFAAARKIAIPAVAGALVGTGVTLATGGMAAPVIAEAGLSGAAAAVTTSAISGAAGGGAAQMTSNAIRGKSLTDGAPSAMLAGAALGAAGEVIGQSAQAFKSAFKEASAITPSARGVAGTTNKDITVYRVFGGDSRVEGYSWTPVYPRAVSNFRDVAGLPSGGTSGYNNTADFMVKGVVKPRDIIKSHPAIPLDGNKGGLPEFKISPKNVTIKDIPVLKP
jgi:RHS repeat-associated protein